jgi:mono/diheme cytochrome c family protein
MISGFRHALCASGIFLGCSMALLIGANHPLAHASDAGARDRGAHIFHTTGCESCHSITGVGGDRAPDLSSVGQRRNSGQIRKQILTGGKGMPPFKTVLTKSEVKDLVAFLTSCRTDSVPGCREWTATQPAQ